MMMGGTKKMPRGYTIVETMIFLAVTGAIFLTAMIFLNGRQRKTEFSQAVRDFESQIQDIANNVSTGYYSKTGDFGCQATGNAITFTVATKERGTNSDCTFIGQVLQIRPDAKTAEYYLYPVAGLRSYNPGAPVKPRDVQNLVETSPKAIANGYTQTLPGGVQEIIERVKLGGGATFGLLKYNGVTAVCGLGIFSTLGVLSGGGVLQSGTVKVDTYGIGCSNNESKDLIDKINNVASWGSNKNPQEGFTICINSNSENGHATLSLGGNTRQFATNVIYDSGDCPTT